MTSEGSVTYAPTVPFRRIGPGIALGIALAASVGAQPVPMGSEFRVETYTTGAQASPAAAISSGNDFFVVWTGVQPQSGDDIRARRIAADGTPLGSEFAVNAFTTGDQSGPRVAAAQSGFVVVWTTPRAATYDIHGRRFDSTGDALGSEFTVNSDTAHDHDQGAVAPNGAGFVVVWTSSGQDGSGYGVFGQRFDSGGARFGSEVRINSVTAGDQDSPAVAGNADGFVVVWRSDACIRGRRFASSGMAVGSEFQVNANDTLTGLTPSVATSGAGDFAVAWTDYDDATTYSDVVARFFTSTGQAVGSMRVNTDTSSEHTDPQITVDGAGNFVVTWNGPDTLGNGSDVLGRRFLQTGRPSGTEFHVNSYTTADQTLPCVVANPRGDFLVVWEDDAGEDGSGSGIFAQAFLPSPTTTTLATTTTTTTDATTSPTSSTSTTTAPPSIPTTTTLPDGCVTAVTFTSVECRLDFLRQRVANRTFKPTTKLFLLARLRAARTQTTRALSLRTKRGGKVARRLLANAAGEVGRLVARVHSRDGRRNVPADLQTVLVDVGSPLRDALRGLRADLTP